jgi:hypothetical protein
LATEGRFFGRQANRTFVALAAFAVVVLLGKNYRAGKVPPAMCS